MRTFFSDFNITGAAVVAAAAAVILTLTVGLRLICTCRHDTGCTCMLVLTRLCHPRAFPPPKKSLRPTNKPGNQTNSNTPKDTQKEHTNQHAKAEGQRDRAASCDGNKPHPKPTTPDQSALHAHAGKCTHCQKGQQGTLVNPGTNTSNSAATLHYIA
jgi:hypothetical protein